MEQIKKQNDELNTKLIRQNYQQDALKQQAKTSESKQKLSE